MEIIMQQDEIEKALKTYLGSPGLGIDLSGRDVKIDLKAGRGDNGHTARIEILAVSEKQPSEPNATEDDQGINFDDD